RVVAESPRAGRQPSRHPGFLSRRANGVGIRRARQGPEGGRRVLRTGCRSAGTKITLAEESDRAGAGDESAGARSLWRGRPRHPARPGRRNESGPAIGRKDLRDQDLSRRAPRLPRRLPPQLPQGGSRGRLEPDDRLVQEVQSAHLIAAIVAAERGVYASRSLTSESAPAP